MEKAKRPRKRPGRKDRGKIIGRLILILAIFYVCTIFYKQHREMQYLKDREAGLIRDIGRVEKDIESLKSQLENSNTDEHIERIAREHLKMVKEDEMIFIDLGKGP